MYFMKKNKIKFLHIFTYTLFIDPYIDFINKNFNSRDHFFLILTKKEKFKPRQNAKKISRDIRELFFLIRNLYKCEKFFLHGLVHYEIVLIFFVQPWLLKKCYWVLLGEDLYWHKLKNKGLLRKIYDEIRRFIIKRIKGIIASFKGDYDLAQKWYNVQGKYHHSFLYPNFIYKKIKSVALTGNVDSLRIQVGHSADCRDNHFLIFDLLKKHKDKNIEIVCPLVYGDKNYRKKITEQGIKIFGAKFESLNRLLSVDEYSEFLAKTDIAIFGHKGNFAGGNIIILLGLGKKVYTRNDTTSYAFFKSLGLKIYNFDDELKDIFEVIPEKDSSENINIIKSYYTEENLKKQWNSIISD